MAPNLTYSETVSTSEDCRHRRRSLHEPAAFQPLSSVCSGYTSGQFHIVEISLDFSGSGGRQRRRLPAGVGWNLQSGIPARATLCVKSAQARAYYVEGAFHRHGQGLTTSGQCLPEHAALVFRAWGHSERTDSQRIFLLLRPQITSSTSSLAYYSFFIDCGRLCFPNERGHSNT